MLHATLSQSEKTMKIMKIIKIMSEIIEIMKIKMTVVLYICRVQW